MSSTLAPASFPLRLWLPAGLGLAWSLFGLTRFLATAFATPETLIAGGMTPEQAALYAGLPLWLNLAFALGVLGGVLGCALLLLRRRAAVPVLGLSLGAYLALFLGDITEGVFAAFGPGQVLILTVVVLVAAGLFWLARRLARQAVLG